MRTVQSLIDEAIDLCKGNQSELARRIGMKPQDIQAMHAGRRPVSPETVGLLCDVLQLDGEEARRLAVEAIVGNPKNAEKAQVLRRAFFVAWALGVLVCGFSATEETQAAANSDRNAPVVSGGYQSHILHCRALGKACFKVLMAWILSAVGLILRGPRLPLAWRSA